MVKNGEAYPKGIFWHFLAKDFWVLIKYTSKFAYRSFVWRDILPI